MLQHVFESDGSLAVVQFNPWFFTGASDLAQRFYLEVGRATEQRRGVKLDQVGRSLTKMGESLGPLVPDPHYRVLVTWVTRLLKRPAPTLAEAHKKLRRALDKSSRRLVVFVDDIDRLRSDEVREVLRFVRMTSDLPNVTFILAYDGQRVASQLGSDHYGERYLEKIVQLTVDLPLIRESRLTTDFTKRLSESVPARMGQAIGRHWPEHFHSYIRPLLHNSRDIIRVANALKISIDLLGDEIDLSDLVVLETVRVLSPGLFLSLRTVGVVALTTAREQHAVGEAAPEAIQARLDQLLRQAGGDEPYMRLLLQGLFPTTNTFLGGANHANAATWRRDRRVAAQGPMAVYFHGGADSGEIGTPEVRRAIELMTAPTAFEDLLRALPPQQLADLLERLEDFEYSYPTGAEVSVAPILRQMRRLSKDAPGFMEFGQRVKASRVVFRLLRDAPAERRDGIVKALYAVLDTYSEKFELVEMVGHREHVGHRLVTPDVATALERQLLYELVAADPSDLANEWDLLGMVLRATRWHPEEPEIPKGQWLGSATFVAGLILNSLGCTKYGDGQRQARLQWEATEEFFGPEAWEHSVTTSEVLDQLPGNVTYLVAKYLSGWRPVDFGDIDPMLSF